MLSSDHEIESLINTVKQMPTEARTLALSGPDKLVTRIGDAPKHTYRKLPFMGEERFVFISAYRSKTNKAICVFEQESGGKVVEIPLHECKTKFADFIAMLSMTYVGLGKSEVEGKDDDKTKYQYEQEHRRKLMENSVFGSW